MTKKCIISVLLVVAWAFLASLFLQDHHADAALPGMEEAHL